MLVGGGLLVLLFWHAFFYLGIMFVVSDVGECSLSLSVCVW